MPEAVAGQFGPQFAALIAYLTVGCRIPRRLVQTLLEDALHVPISLGSTQAAWEEAGDAVTAPCEELEAALAQQPVLKGDETGHRTNGDKRWLGRSSPRGLSCTGSRRRARPMCSSCCSAASSRCAVW